jgi:hypothetical protein
VRPASTKLWAFIAWVSGLLVAYSAMIVILTALISVLTKFVAV